MVGSEYAYTPRSKVITCNILQVWLECFMVRRQYDIVIIVNGRKLSLLVIDPHYLHKHAESVTDDTIIELVKKLDGREFLPEKVGPSGFEYYVEDKMRLKGKTYKLI